MSRHSLCTYICLILFWGYIPNRHISLIDMFRSKVIYHIDMFWLVVKPWIICHIYSSVTVAKQSIRYINPYQLLDSTLQPEMMFSRHSKCHMFSFTSASSNGPLFSTSPGDPSISNLKDMSRKPSSCIETIAVRCIHISSHFELIIPRKK